MLENLIQSAPVRAYNVVAPDGTVVSSWDYRQDATKDLRDNKAVYLAGCRILTERGLRRFRAHLAGGMEALNENPGFFNNIKRKRKQEQTFEEACYQRKPPGLRPRQTVVVDNEGRYFLVSENTPEHQRLAGYREVLVFPCDKLGTPSKWSEVGGRQGVNFDTFLTDLLEGRETLDQSETRNPGGAKQIREQSRPYAFQLRSESGNSASFQSHAEALKWAESNLKKGEFFTISKDSDHFHEHYVKLEGRETLDQSETRNPGGAKQRARGTREFSERSMSWQAKHARHMSAAESERMHAGVDLDRHDAQAAQGHVGMATHHRRRAKETRVYNRNFLFIYGTQRESFATEAEALDWADNSASVPKFASFTILDQIRDYPKHYRKI